MNDVWTFFSGPCSYYHTCTSNAVANLKADELQRPAGGDCDRKTEKCQGHLFLKREPALWGLEERDKV